MSLSRREFLKGFVPKLKEEEKAPQQEIYNLGRVGSFPVGTETVIKLGDKKFLMKSLAQGLQLLNLETHQIQDISMGADGSIITNINKTWPEESVLSFFSGQIYRLAEDRHGRK